MNPGDGGDRDRWARHAGAWRAGGHGDPRWGGPGRHGPGGRRGPGAWRGPGRGFGCLFAIVFLVIAGSMLAAAVAIFSRLGLVAGVITILVVVGALSGLARGLRRTGRTLDELVEEIPYDETRGYVKRVLRSYAAYRILAPVQSAARGAMAGGHGG